MSDKGEKKSLRPAVRCGRSYKSSLGPFENRVNTMIFEMNQNRIQERIWAHDHSVWKENPSEITNRLGWLHSPKRMERSSAEIKAFAESIRREGFQRVLLLGMGGSSLAPEVFRLIFGVKDGYPDLSVIDTTHPDTIADWTRRIQNEKTLFVVSTKSGTTVETLSLMNYFYNVIRNTRREGNPGNFFVAITDPGSSLETDARQLGFRHVFFGDPEIGGRYSAISPFGLVPAALIGMDIERIMQKARLFAAPDEPTALHLGVSMGELALAGKEKLTLICSKEIEPFGAWVEQLIAESTGKEGKGIFPVISEPPISPAFYSPDRFFVHLRLKTDTRRDRAVRELKAAGHPVVGIDLNEPYDLCSEFFRWEMAAAIAGACLKINPFDQPNVESAKIRSREIVRLYLKSGSIPEIRPDGEENGIDIFSPSGETEVKTALKHFFSGIETSRTVTDLLPYVCIQAYASPNPELDKALQKFRLTISKRFRTAVAVGYGPRFLHSTGQLHKGDSGHGLFIQLTGQFGTDLPIPDKAGQDPSSITFGILMISQAIGDRQALLDSGRKVIRFHFKRDVILGIDYLLHRI
ncbi:MAG: glucose-6-phosphate isomerase [Thermodesulfobacteriota bacterium]